MSTSPSTASAPPCPTGEGRQAAFLTGLHNVVLGKSIDCTSRMRAAHYERSDGYRSLTDLKLRSQSVKESLLLARQNAAAAGEEIDDDDLEDDNAYESPAAVPGMPYQSQEQQQQAKPLPKRNIYTSTLTRIHLSVAYAPSGTKNSSCCPASPLGIKSSCPPARHTISGNTASCTTTNPTIPIGNRRAFISTYSAAAAATAAAAVGVSPRTNLLVDALMKQSGKGGSTPAAAAGAGAAAGSAVPLTANGGGTGQYELPPSVSSPLPSLGGSSREARSNSGGGSPFADSVQNAALMPTRSRPSSSCGAAFGDGGGEHRVGSSRSALSKALQQQIALPSPSRVDWCSRSGSAQQQQAARRASCSTQVKAMLEQLERYPSCSGGDSGIASPEGVSPVVSRAASFACLEGLSTRMRRNSSVMLIQLPAGGSLCGSPQQRSPLQRGFQQLQQQQAGGPLLPLHHGGVGLLGRRVQSTLVLERSSSASLGTPPQP